MINSKCICNTSLNEEYDNIMLEPCEHILHSTCYNNYYKIICPICKINIKDMKTYTEIKKNRNKSKYHYDKYIDMVAMSNYNSDTQIDIIKIIPKSINLIKLCTNIPFMYGYDDGKKGCEEILAILNTNISVSGLNYIKKPNIYIATHTSYLDAIILFYILHCGFMASSQIEETTIGQYLKDIIPLLIIKRGSTNNTVEKIKEYLQTNESMCIFPEGMMSHPDTLLQFRTGAFNTGYSVYPVIIKYEPLIHDNDLNIFIKKLLSSENLKITVDIMPEQKPPFNEIKIDNIRKMMAKKGNLVLSRVTNRDIRDN